MPPRERWTDERLDDLATLARTNDGRLDHVEKKVEDHGRTLATNTEARSANRAVYLMLAAILLTEIAQIVGNHIH